MSEATLAMRQAVHMGFSVVLFDLDGTLTDSGPGIMRSVSYSVSALDLPPLTDDELRAFIGPPLQDSFAALGLSREDVDRAVEKYREYFSETGLYENSVYAGVEGVLRQLKDRGVRMAVATSKPTVFARRILDHFDLAQYFEHIVGAELDGSRRHKNEVIEEVLARLRIEDFNTVVMVGDRAEDVQGASKLGIACIGAGWGYGREGELDTAGATCVVAVSTNLLTRLLHP